MMITEAGLFRIETSPYKRRIRAWTMYNWANSAFATTILGAVLPVYYSRVAAATLPSEATATAYWSLGLAISLLVVAVLSPILGTISDISRNKKRLLGFFTGLGVVGTTLLVLVDTGDWLLASIVFVVARIGHASAIVFYDALLPHVAVEADRDRVSTRGHALGYLGGGLLLAVNAAMIQLIPGTWGARLSFVSVGVWWAVFSIPILTRVPEPPTGGIVLGAGESVLGATYRHLRGRLKDIRRYRELFKFLVAFLIYNDAIGTIIGVGAIYGAELGFGTLELVLALLLIQFVGIPFSLLFGQLPSQTEKRRPAYLAFIVYSLVALPVVGIAGGILLPPASQNNLAVIMGLILGVELAGVVFALLLGQPLFGRLADRLDTKRSIALSLVVFIVIAIFGFVLRSVIEFWFLAWMVALVLGGSQALSRSLFADMSPAAKSGEFFGLYSVMSKFSSIIGPLLFAIAAALFGTSRLAILSLVALFVIGGYLLMRVDVEEGQRVAHEEDANLTAVAQTR